jgi:hypothetical protein
MAKRVRRSRAERVAFWRHQFDDWDKEVRPSLRSTAIVNLLSRRFICGRASCHPCLSLYRSQSPRY